MKILHSLRSSLFLGGLMFSGLATAQAAEAPRPNIIFILCDDLGYGDVGVFYQNQRAALKDRAVPFFSTPHIDTMAQDGVKVTQHYCAAPVCAPSRASLLTGLTQGHANVRNNQFDKALADTHTLGSVLRTAGYATAAIGKWGLQGTKQAGLEDAPGTGSPATWPAYATKRGFDFYFGYVAHKDGHFHYPKEDGRKVWENDREISADLDLCYTADLFTARAKKWISEQTASNPRKPFFLYLAYDTPHAKLQNPPCAYPAGGGLRGGVQWTGKPHAMLNTATGEMDRWMHPDYAEATWDHDHASSTPEVAWPDVQKRYANDVRRIDDCVGDLFHLLKDLKIEDNTMVVFTSDNGPSEESYLKESYTPDFFHGFGPFDGIKRDTLEGGVREPTLVKWPRGIPGRRVDEHASGHWDWLATFAELAGVPTLAATDGVSLVPSLTGRGEQRPSTIYTEYVSDGRTPKFSAFEQSHRGRKRGEMQNIIIDGFKGIRYDIKSADDDFEIYDLRKDPKESQNLTNSPELSKLQATMKARVLQLRLPDSSAPRPYDKAPVPPVNNEPHGEPGLTWSLFKGSWPWMPDFSVMTADSSGNVAKPDLSMALAGQALGISYEGYFLAAAEGNYTFTVESDGAAMMFLHDIRLIGESKSIPQGATSGTLLLKAGWHPVRLYYRNSGESSQLALKIQDEAGNTIELGETNLRQKSSKP